MNMPLNWRNVIMISLVRTNYSKSGVGKSIEFFGFSSEIKIDDLKYWSFGNRGTGFCYNKYY